MKRIFTMLFAFALLLSLLAGCKTAQNETNNVSSQAESNDEGQAESSGTPNESLAEEKQISDYFAETVVLKDGTTIYCIDTAEQLYGFAELVNERKHNFAGEVVLVRNDIELNSTENISDWKNTKPENVWIPVGDNSFAFKGEFAGGYIEEQRYLYKNVTISGIYCPQYEGAAAFFGEIENAKIAHITLDKSIFCGPAENEYGDSAGFALRAYDSEITWCENRLDLSGNRASGIVFSADGTAVTWCNNYGNITAESFGGGIVELLGSGEVFNCVNMGNVTAGTAGGVICNALGSGSIAIASCANYGDITGNEFAGGIIGVIDAEQTIITAIDLLNVGRVTALGREYPEENRGNAGGIVGYYNIMSISGLGDIFIKNVLNIGEVSCKYNQGAIVGKSRNEDAVLQDCYYLDSSCKDGGLGTCVKKSELTDGKKLKLIDNIDWAVIEDNWYPILYNTRIPFEI